jgi:predicted GIY-YIG superfamily endonuclease
LKWVVYAIRENSEIIYIGSTSRRLSLRLAEHRCKKGLSSNATIERICAVSTRSEAEKKEEHLINLIGIHRLINKTAHQRKGGLGMKHTHETKDRIRTANTGRKNTWSKSWTEERRIISIKAMKGVKKREGAVNEKLKKNGYKEFDLYRHGQFIGRFINQSHAAKALGMAKSTFVDIFKGVRINKKGVEVKYVS